MICDHWDVAVVPFPFMELPVSKNRPALAISTRAFNSKNEHTVFAMITKAKQSTWPSDHLIMFPEHAGLVKNCYVRWKTFTLPNNMITSIKGNLSPQDRTIVEAQVRAMFVPA